MSSAWSDSIGQRACGQPVKGAGLLDWMCEMSRGHVGPCMSTSSPISMTARKAWEAGNAQRATPMPPPPPPPPPSTALLSDYVPHPAGHTSALSPSQTLRLPSLHDRLQSLVDRDPNLLPPAVKAWVSASEAEASLACLYALASQEFARGAVAVSLTHDELVALIPPSLLALMRKAQTG